MSKSFFVLFFAICLIGCQSTKEPTFNEAVLPSMGNKYRTEWSDNAKILGQQLAMDSTNVAAWLNLADANILLFAYGLKSRAATIPLAREAYKKVIALDSTSSRVHQLSGLLYFFDWKWEPAKRDLLKAIQANPANLSARHWYSLWLCAMKQCEGALLQHDTITQLDKNKDFLVGKASIYYFLEQFEKMKPLMFEAIKLHPEVPWSYDWLGMAYNGLDEHQDAITTYYKAFELSDGTVEVGGGLGHALGDAGKIEEAKKIAAYYHEAAKTHYLPPCQRAFIHISIGDKEGAIQLLEQAYKKKSWFLIFMQIEHWYDPIRNTPRFAAIAEKMNFPK